MKNEGDAITTCLERITATVTLPFEVLVVFDDEADTTVPPLEKFAETDARVVALPNSYGPGPAQAIRCGIDSARAPVIVVTMADGSDDTEQIDELCKLVERGVVIAAASRYMSGGQQIGGPPLKSLLSRLAGLSLYWVARVGTRDATNSFKAYSTPFVRDVGVESASGFEVGIELVAKARRLRLPVAELPTIWLERAQGTSNFKVLRWLPRYLKWYRFAFRTASRARPGAFDRREPARVTDEPNGKQVLVTGSAGFIGGYVVEELLGKGYSVVGVDDYSKYGRIAKSYDEHPRYRLIEGDATDVGLMTEAVADCDHFVAGAALIGGISYFHAFAYDLLATNERIMAASCDAAIKAHREGRLEKVTYMSSSMVFESATSWPSVEGQQREIPPPISSYGFQKLAVEYYALAAHSQYDLPYTICRPFNCVGVGEMRARSDVEVLSGNVKLAMSHVVPDLIQKVVKGQDPLHILGDGHQIRHYTYGADLARGIVTAMEHPAALNEDFNLSTAQSTNVLELAENIWHRLRGADAPFRYVSDESFEHDVQKRVPSVEKARDLLGFEATTTLDEMLDVVVPWVVDAIDNGLI